MKSFLYLVCLLCSLPVFAAEVTESRTIERIQLDGVGGSFYFYNSAGWGAPGCPNAVYSYLRNSTSGRQEIISIGLAAKVTNKKVQFEGTCPSASYFLISHIHF